MEEKCPQLPSFFGAFFDHGEPCWRPAADIFRTRTGWLIKYDLAGVATRDIDVSIAGTTIILGGCRRDSSLEEGCSHYAMEISYSRFERAVELPCVLDRARLKIQWRDGILLLSVFCQGESS